MASTPQAFWQTLLAAQSKLSTVLAGTTNLLGSIYTDVEPEQAALGQTINVPVPSSVLAQVTNSTSSDPVFNDYNVSTVGISLNQHPQWGTKIRSFDQYNSPQKIADTLLDPAIKAIAMKANAIIAALLTAANFPTNPIVATTGGAITPDQFVFGGYNALLNQNVNVFDTTAMKFVQHPTPFSKQQRNNDWAQESQVGVEVAMQAKVQGAIKVAYGSQMLVDQQMPTTGSNPNQVYTSVYMSRYAIAGVFRPLPPGDEKVAYITYVDWKGLPIKITMGYSTFHDAWLLNVDTGFGVSVVRPEQAVLFSTAQ